MVPRPAGGVLLRASGGQLLSPYGMPDYSMPGDRKDTGRCPYSSAAWVRYNAAVVAPRRVTLATARRGGARAMGTFDWSPEHGARLAAIRDDLAEVSTATAFTLLHQHGWRNTYMKGLQLLQELRLG